MFPSMFPLGTATFPSSAPDLERMLNRCLQRIFSVEADPVSIRDASYPHLDEIRISLDGAGLRQNPPRPPAISGGTSPALRVDRISISALPLSIGPATIDLSVSACTVVFAQGRDANDQVVLSLESATAGKLEGSIAQTDLEALVAGLAGTQANQRGITIDSVRLKLRQESTHSVAAEVVMRVRKLFLSASLCLTGHLNLNDQLDMKISALNCTSDGAISSLARGILTPYLQKIDGREFSLRSFGLGNVRLRDVRLSVADSISITAEFGNAA